MLNEKRLSIIVPAYKVEKYIEKCLRSLLSQDIPLSDYEIIVTNDGSPDGSAEIVEKLQKEFSNLILINQENQGVSMARNNAIAIAKGKYIMAIDPDDYVIPNTLSKILDTAENKNLDVCYLGYEIFDNESKSIWKTDFSKHQSCIFNGVEGYFAHRGKAIKDPDHSVAILYKKSMLDEYNILYPKDVPFLEDGLFLGKVFSVAQNVGFIDVIFYQRTTREGAATTSGVFYSEKAINGFIMAASDIYNFATNLSLNKKQQGLVNHVIIKFVLLALFPTISFKNLSSFNETIEKLKENGFGKLNTDGVFVGIYKNYAKAYNISKYLFLIQYAKNMMLGKIVKK